MIMTFCTSVIVESLGLLIKITTRIHISLKSEATFFSSRAATRVRLLQNSAEATRWTRAQNTRAWEGGRQDDRIGTD